MNRSLRSLVALVASGIILAIPATLPQALAQPRTPCDQLLGRLGEIQVQEAAIREDLAAAQDTGDLFLAQSAMDRLEGLLSDTEALLQRMDECFRSPVPSQAD